MTVDFLSLKFIWDFIRPILHDLLKEGGKGLIERAKQPKTKEDFYRLYGALTNVEESLRSFLQHLEPLFLRADKDDERVEERVMMLGMIGGNSPSLWTVWNRR